MENAKYGSDLFSKCILRGIWCFVLCSSVANARTVYFSDDFENGLGQWETGSWQLTDAFFRSASHAISDSPEGKYAPNANSTIVMRVRSQADLIDLSESIDPVLAFWHRVSVHSTDYALVEISEDFGFTWSELVSFNNVDRWSAWSRVQVDLSDYRTSPIMIRFRLRDYGYHQWHGWDIDDIVIADKDDESLAPPFFEDFESGLDNWMVEEGDAWQLTENVSRSRGHAISESPDGHYLPGEFSDLILSHPIDLSSLSWPILTFWHQVSVHPTDYAYVDISEDVGLTWSELVFFNGVDQSTWSRVQVNLSDYRESSIMIRFRLSEYGYHQWGGWDIDDVEIRELFYEQFPLPDIPDHPDIPDSANPVDPLVVKITSVDASECPTIRTGVIVIDMTDEPVAGLDASNFTVQEDGVVQTPITVELSRSHIRASLLLDYSASMPPEALAALETASRNFLGYLVAGDHAQVIKFASGVEVLQEYTDDREALRQAIEHEPDLDLGSTSLYDAIYQSISGTAEQAGNRAVIAMSDGADNSSVHSATSVMEHALAKGVPVFTIGLGHLIDEDVLIAIAAKTGGLYYCAPTPQDLGAIYERIAGTLSSQYLVTYDTAINDPAGATVEHDLMIAVSVDDVYGEGVKQFIYPADCSPAGLGPVTP